jgi:hypothetical protein
VTAPDVRGADPPGCLSQPQEGTGAYRAAARKNVAQDKFGKAHVSARLELDAALTIADVTAYSRRTGLGSRGI